MKGLYRRGSGNAGHVDGRVSRAPLPLLRVDRERNDDLRARGPGCVESTSPAVIPAIPLGGFDRDLNAASATTRASSWVVAARGALSQLDSARLFWRGGLRVADRAVPNPYPLLQMPTWPQFQCPEVQLQVSDPIRDVHVQEVPPVHVAPFSGRPASQTAAGPFTQC